MENRTSDTQVCPHIHAPQGVIYSLHSFEAVPDNTCWKNIRILYRKHNLHRPLCYLCVSNLFTVHLVWPCDASNTCLYFTEREREPLGKQDCSTDWGYTHVRTHTHTHFLSHIRAVWAVDGEEKIVSVTSNGNEGVDHRCLSQWCNTAALTAHHCQWSVSNLNRGHKNSPLSLKHTRIQYICCTVKLCVCEPHSQSCSMRASHSCILSCIQYRTVTPFSVFYLWTLDLKWIRGRLSGTAVDLLSGHNSPCLQAC